MYNNLLRYLLNQDYQKVVSKTGIILRKLFSPVFRNIITKLAVKNKLIIERRVILPKNKRYIFAATHGFHDDIIMSIRVCGRHTYLLYGSHPDFFETYHGYGLWLNGVILVDRRNKDSRNAAKNKTIYALNLGANILMFPEGTWNKTPNQLVMKLFPGIYDVAKRTDALIVPIATIQEDSNIYAIMDKPFNITEFSREEGIIMLRDKLCSIKYELMEKHSFDNRNNIGDAQMYWSQYLHELIATTNGHYDYKVENTAHFVDKRATKRSDVFSHLTSISPTYNNAFLFSKRNHD